MIHFHCDGGHKAPSHFGAGCGWPGCEHCDPSQTTLLIPGSMLGVLEHIEAQLLPEWLQSSEGWATKYIDYHPPLVERAFRDWEGYRISLHRIHPCKASDAFFHPHPWPGAFRVWGRYEMGVGFGPGTTSPTQAMTLLTAPGAAYEMLNPDLWHYVRPHPDPVVTVMVTGKPWPRESPRTADQPFRALTAEEMRLLMSDLLRHYTG